MIGAGRNRSVPVADVAVRQPTLDDVFLRLTGEPVTRPDEEPNGASGKGSPNGHGSKKRRRNAKVDAKVGAGHGSKER